MDWKAIVAELKTLRLTQEQIAEACGCRQTTISALSRGKTRNPGHDLGQKLTALLQAKRAAAAAEARARSVGAQPAAEAVAA